MSNEQEEEDDVYQQAQEVHQPQTVAKQLAPLIRQSADADNQPQQTSSRQIMDHSKFHSSLVTSEFQQQHASFDE